MVLFQWFRTVPLLLIITKPYHAFPLLSIDIIYDITYNVLKRGDPLMSAREKLLKKLKNAKFAEFDEIHLLLTQLGFDFRSNGSHYTYTKAPYIIGIVKRSGKPVKRVYLENLKDLLERMGL